MNERTYNGYTLKELKNTEKSPVKEAAGNALPELIAHIEEVEAKLNKVAEMACEEKCGWNCCSHGILMFIDGKAGK